MSKGRIALCALSAVALASCSIGVKKTPGMNLYSAGDFAKAIPVLEQEVKDGQVSARYSLGLAYRDGTGVTRDADKAEILLTGAAIGGDPRAVSAIRAMLEPPRCDKDKRLRSHWGGIGLMHRNLVTGVVELNSAPPVMLRQMAEIYEEPCEGRPRQPQAAAALRGLSGGPRRVWIYVPG
ncbi:hypothetical protein SH584_05830 [Sphingomonas sp. LY29]|uniref:hypothetical protein n=1 Tax=Sphingomonas sp. LY29 TaxID=3095341 RepID=UPI002D7722B6|nr:hypothetical protein [Sphingomonas sp. LY29]WRP26940.1 hypothetical protein SH584_05830 [Sphingomonas sp. LY29]